jgi:hypothetical protein
VSQQTAVTLTAVALMKTQNKSQYCNSRQIITATKTPAVYLCHCLTTAHIIQTVFFNIWRAGFGSPEAVFTMAVYISRPSM